jgi:hypothetical protein
MIKSKREMKTERREREYIPLDIFLIATFSLVSIFSAELNMNKNQNREYRGNEYNQSINKQNT